MGSWNTNHNIKVNKSSFPYNFFLVPYAIKFGIAPNLKQLGKLKDDIP
jgi:hypothetical protein